MIAPDLFEFAYVPDWYGHLTELERLALPELWKFRKPSRETKNTDTPILERYIHTIFRKQVMDNVYVRQDPAGNIKMDKEKSTEKIDATVATVMALDHAIRNQGSEGSVYDGRGILVF